MNRTVTLLLLGLFVFACTPSQPEQNQKPSGQETQKPGGETPPGNGSGTETPPATEEPDFSDPDWYQTFFWDRTDRQKAGLRGPVKSIHASTPIYSDDRYNIFTFDKAGHLVKNEFKRIDTDEYNHTTTYTYDDAGHRIKMEFTDGRRTSGYTCEYKNGNRYVAVNGKDWIHQDGVLLGDDAGYVDCQDLVGILKGLSKIHFERLDEGVWVDIRDYEYVFGEDGNLTITLTQSSGQESTSLTERVSTSYVTYKDGLPCSGVYPTDLGSREVKVQWQSNGMPAQKWETGGETIDYEENNRTVLPKKIYGTVGWGGMGASEFFYDEHFDLVKRSLDANDDKNGLHYDDYSTYTYDKYGNWTSRKEVHTPYFWDGTDAGKRTYTVYNVMEYYE